MRMKKLVFSSFLILTILSTSCNLSRNVLSTSSSSFMKLQLAQQETVLKKDKIAGADTSIPNLQGKEYKPNLEGTSVIPTASGLHKFSQKRITHKAGAPGLKLVSNRKTAYAQVKETNIYSDVTILMVVGLILGFIGFVLALIGFFDLVIFIIGELLFILGSLLFLIGFNLLLTHGIKRIIESGELNTKNALRGICIGIGIWIDDFVVILWQK